jgi:DNA-directed RNA polymerase subunit RPC12/RpoP
MFLSTLLKYYKRQDIQQAIVDNSRFREVAIKYGDRGFGKRPDVIRYPHEVLELAKQGATSFHLSEELWQNPLQLDTGMRKQDLDTLRTGWDLVLDVDFEEWECTKLITKALIHALRQHGINCVTVKFSGNKGFHIGVPFEAFPGRVKGIPTKHLFPDGVKRIAAYLVDYVDSRDQGFPLSKQIIDKYSSVQTTPVCTKCGKEKDTKTKSSVEFICPRCESRVTHPDAKLMKCRKCKILMERFDSRQGEKCSCGNARFLDKVNLKIDTMLISSRHMFRSAYSLHEKSELASVPIDPDSIAEFERDMAKPELVKPRLTFLDRMAAVPGEASQLIVQAYDYKPILEEEKEKEIRHYTLPDEKIPEQFFPPCIKLILKGIDDGRARSVFILLNFLRNCAWPYDDIKALLIEWNKRNKEQLRDTNLLGPIRYHKQKKRTVLPPNCDSQMYYLDIGVCKQDPLCAKIKNPVNYTRIKARYHKPVKKKSKKSS